MATQVARVVNRSFAGEPEYIVIQELETNRVFELSQIQKVIEADGSESDIVLENNKFTLCYQNN